MWDGGGCSVFTGGEAVAGRWWPCVSPVTMRAGSIDWRVGSWRIISATSSESGAGSCAANAKDGVTPCPISLEVDCGVSCSVSSDTNTISGGAGDAGSGGMESEGTGVTLSGVVGAEHVVGEGVTGVEGNDGEAIIIATRDENRSFSQARISS